MQAPSADRDPGKMIKLLRLTPRPLPHPNRLRGRLLRLLLLLRLGCCLGRAGILRRSPPPLLFSVSFGWFLFLLLWCRFCLLLFRLFRFLWRSSSALGSSPCLLGILLRLNFFGGFALLVWGFRGGFVFGGWRFRLFLGGGVVFFFFVAVRVTARSLFFDVELGLVLHDVVTGAGESDCRVVGLSGFLDGVAALGLDGDFAFCLLFGDFSGWGGAVPVP